MKFVTEFFNSLPISEALRARIYTATPQPRHLLYLQLPAMFAPAFPGVSEAQLQELTLASYLYFRYVQYLDDLLDGDAGTTGAEEGQLLLIYGQLHEHAIRRLAHLFPKGHQFWVNFAQCQQVFALAQHQEQAAARLAGPWTQAAFEQLAVGKSAVCEALVYALHGLSADGQHLEAALDCLRQYHLASQYEDDILDFCEDCQRGQNTYVYSQVMAYVQQQHFSQDSPLSPRMLQSVLYTSGIGERHLTEAEQKYRRAAAQAQLLGIEPLHQAALHQADVVARKCAHVRQLAEAAKVRANELLQQEAA